MLRFKSVWIVKIIIILTIMSLIYPLQAEVKIDRGQKLGLFNYLQLPELRARVDDGTLLLIRLNPNFVIQEFGNDGKIERKIFLSDNTIIIEGVGPIQRFKLDIREEIISK